MPPRDWKVRLDDMIDAIERISAYVSGLTFEQFEADRRTIDAVLHNFDGRR